MTGVQMTLSDALNVALKHLAKGENDPAEKLCLQILHHDPNNVGAMMILGSVTTTTGRLEDARKIFLKALSYENQPAAIRMNLYSSLADTYSREQQTDEAIKFYKKAFALHNETGCGSAEDATMFLRFGKLLLQNGQIQEAMSLMEGLLQFAPQEAQAYHLLGLAYNATGEVEQAIACCRKAETLAPKNPAAAISEIGFLKSVNRYGEAKKRLVELLKKHPRNAQLHALMGNIEFALKPESAIRHYKNALKIDPHCENAILSLYSALNHVCAWDQREKLVGKVNDVNARALRQGQPARIFPLDDIMENPDPAQNLQVAKSFSRRIENAVAPYKQNFSFEERKQPNKKLTIGYLSSDFRSHPIFHLTNNMYKYHDRNKFKIIAYSCVNDPEGSYRRKIEEDCDAFVDLSTLNNRDAAQKIYNDEVDILVDLNGHTSGARLEIPALKPAPVQLTYLGFIGSSGARFYDYIITDKITTPFSEAPHYTEKFIYMPHCFQVNDNEAVISDKTYSRTELGLPEDVFVFCCFNQAIKIEPVIFAVWMHILERCPDSVLWLQGKGSRIEKNLRREAEKHSIDPKRLIFSERSPYSEYLKRCSYADIALDTRIYNGGTLTSNMLWAGLPVITLQGTHFASRMASSIISATGIEECITHSLKEYEEFAVHMVKNPGQCQELRKKLKENIPTCPLFDTKNFVANLDKAYRKAWDNFLDGKIDHIQSLA